MKKFLVNYTETYTGQIEVEAKSKDEAMNKVRDKIDCDELDPTKNYDGHDVTVDFAEEV